MRASNGPKELDEFNGPTGVLNLAALSCFI